MEDIVQIRVWRQRSPPYVNRWHLDAVDIAASLDFVRGAVRVFVSRSGRDL